MHVSYLLFAFALMATVQLVAGHGAIINAVGDAGGNGSALGIIPSTPRDGTTKNPFEQDTTRFKGSAADTFGETLAGGNNDPETGTTAILSQNGGTLPQITEGGQLSMTLHQVNADGAGPYTCSINSDGTGTSWQAIDVTDQVPGRLGLDPKGDTTDFPLAVAIPAGQTCTGTVAGQTNVCMVRCQNPALAGPFGGVVPVQIANSTTSTTATSAADTTTSTATDTTTSAAADTATSANADTASDTATGAGAETGVGDNRVRSAGDDVKKLHRRTHPRHYPRRETFSVHNPRA